MVQWNYNIVREMITICREIVGNFFIQTFRGKKKRLEAKIPRLNYFFLYIETILSHLKVAV